MLPFEKYLRILLLFSNEQNTLVMFGVNLLKEELNHIPNSIDVIPLRGSCQAKRGQFDTHGHSETRLNTTQTSIKKSKSTTYIYKQCRMHKKGVNLGKLEKFLSLEIYPLYFPF